MPLKPSLAAWCRRLALLCLLFALAPAARAQVNSCTTTSTDGSLGTVSSFSLQSASDRVQVAGGLSCQNLATFLPVSYVRATLTALTPLTGTGGASGYNVPFTVYADSNYSQAMSTGQFVQLNNIGFVTFLNQSGSGVPLYIGTNIGANVPAGTYTGTVTVNWQYAVCVLGVGIACIWSRSPGLTQPCIGICGSPTNWGSGATSLITITLVVTKSCLIDNAPNVNFGTQAFVANFAAVNQNVTVHCTITEGYTVGFDMGDHANAPWRQMQNGSNTIRYNIYYPSTTTVWNTVNPQSMTGLGGTPIAGQSIGYQALIDPTQTSPPAGTYTDNVRVIVSY